MLASLLNDSSSLLIAPHRVREGISSKSRCKGTAFPPRMEQLSRISNVFVPDVAVPAIFSAWFPQEGDKTPTTFTTQKTAICKDCRNPHPSILHPATSPTLLHFLQFTDDRILPLRRGQNFKYIIIYLFLCARWQSQVWQTDNCKNCQASFTNCWLPVYCSNSGILRLSFIFVKCTVDELNVGRYMN